MKVMQIVVSGVNIMLFFKCIRQFGENVEYFESKWRNSGTKNNDNISNEERSQSIYPKSEQNRQKYWSQHGPLASTFIQN
jgi:hypothetical protein